MSNGMYSIAPEKIILSFHENHKKKIKKYEKRQGEEKSTYFREEKTSKMTLVSATKQHSVIMHEYPYTTISTRGASSSSNRFWHFERTYTQKDETRHRY